MAIGAFGCTTAETATPEAKTVAPVVAKLVLPSGTQFKVSLIDALDSVATPPATAERHGAAKIPRWAALTAVVVIALAAMAVAWRARSNAPVAASGTDIIAVLPLTAVSDSSLSRLGHREAQSE